jgi:hypothetical protein
MSRLIRLGVGEAWKLGRFLFDAITVSRYYAGYEDGHRAGVAFTQREMERTK